MDVEHREPINLVKVFTATKARDRDRLGDHVTAWLRDNPGANIVSAIVRLSSDSRFHCLSIVLLCHQASGLLS
jgi:hypothetical protein